MPRYPLTDQERDVLHLWVSNPHLVGYHIIQRLRRMKLSQFRADMALLERVYERIQK